MSTFKLQNTQFAVDATAIMARAFEITAKNKPIGFSATEGMMAAHLLTNMISVFNKKVDKADAEAVADLEKEKEETVAVARKVLMSASKAEGITRSRSSYSPLKPSIEKDEVSGVETLFYELTSTQITEHMKQFQIIDWKKASVGAIHNALIDLSTLINGESQMVIDSAKKFYPMESVLDLMQAGREYSMIKPEVKINWRDDKAMLERENKKQPKHKKFQVFEDSKIMSNVITTTKPMKIGFAEGFSGPAHKVQLNLYKHMAQVLDNATGADYLDVKYSAEERALITSFVKEYSSTVLSSVYRMKRLFGFLTSMIIANDEMEMAKFRALNGNDDDADAEREIRRGLNDSKMDKYKMVRSMAYSALAPLFVKDGVFKVEDLGVMALYVSYVTSGKEMTADFDILNGTFANTVMARETLLAKARIVGRNNVSGGVEVIPAKGESIKVGDIIRKEDDVLIRVREDGQDTLASKITSKKTLPNGEYKVEDKNGKLYLTKGMKEIFEENGFFDMPEKQVLILPVNLDEDIHKVEEYREGGKVLSVNYAPETNELYKQLNELIGSSVIVSNRQHQGNVVYKSTEEGLVALAETQAYYDHLSEYAHAKIMKLKEVYLSYQDGVATICLFGEIESKHSTDDLPIYKKGTISYQTEEELDESQLLITTDLDEDGEYVEIIMGKEEVTMPERPVVEDKQDEQQSAFNPFNIDTEFDEDDADYTFNGREYDEDEDEDEDE